MEHTFVIKKDLKVMKTTLFFCLLLTSLFVSPALALFSGIAFALLLKPYFQTQSRKVSKYLLQISVVGLGFGMNLHEALKTSSEGMSFTIISVVCVISVGILLGKLFKLDKKLAFLVSSGTAICGGSAIAAVSPVIDADNDQTSMSLAVVFTLNAIAMFLFPFIGHQLGLSQTQFGTWAAIAIHDTSSVVGAGETYGNEALMVATTVKLTRALWIIPLSFVAMFMYKNSSKGKISIPWFIFLFVIAMIINTYVDINTNVSHVINIFSHKALSVTLFLIGGTLSIEAIHKVGAKPIIMGVLLWAVISVLSLSFIML